MKKLKQRKGITLIALVLTIIVLLILAGITINLTIGQDGILRRAEEAGKNYTNAANYEETQLAEFTDLTDKIITSTTQGIDMEVLNLEAGDYIKYDTGVSTVGENGVITCRVLYPASSEYGLQIISDKNVKNITLGVENNYSESTTAYNDAIEDLNDYAEEYINEEYAYDARCVGSAPTVKNGMFVNKDKVKFEGTTEYVVPGATNYVTLQFTNASYIKSYATDINYETDQAQMQAEELWTTGENYWIASRDVGSYSSSCYFTVRAVTTSASDNFSGHYLCHVNSSGDANGRSFRIGLRPCISLKSNEIKIVGNGDGKSADTAYEIEK